MCRGRKARNGDEASKGFKLRKREGGDVLDRSKGGANGEGTRVLTVR